MTWRKSLERYGQLSPVVVCRPNDRYELIDGFKRLGAVRRLAQIDHLSARLMEADERTVKAAIYGLNRACGRTRELEEAWIIHALVREDGMSQVEVGGVAGTAQELGVPASGADRAVGRQDARRSAIGLLSPRRRGRLCGWRGATSPRCSTRYARRRSRVRNWRAWWTCGWAAPIIASSRTSWRIRGSAVAGQRDHPGGPRSAAERGREPCLEGCGIAADVLGRMEVWLAHHGRAGLTAEDRAIHAARFERL